MRAYLIRIAAWLSQGINCILLGGHHDQTVSARAWANRDRQPWRAVYHGLNLIFFWQDDHCRISHAADEEFAREILRDV
jgi:hypothetical protein